MTKAQEEALIEQLRTAKVERDREITAKKLYYHCFDDLWRFGLKRRDRLAEDDLKYLVHHTLVDLIEMVTENKLSLKESLKSYLRGILRNKIFNHLRSRERAEEREKTASWLIAYSISPSPEELFIQQEIDAERIALVNNTLNRLSETCQAIFRLMMKDKSYAEIAEALNYEASGIKVIVFRCREHFREQIRA